MFERLSPAVRTAVIVGVRQAQSLGHGYVGPEHLLLGLLAEPGRFIDRLLAGSGLTYPEAVRRVRASVSQTVRRAGLDGDDVAALAGLGIDVDAIVARAEESFGPGALGSDRVSRPARRRTARRVIRRFRRHQQARRLPFHPESRQVFAAALTQARDLGHKVLGTEHLLLAMLSRGRGTAYELLHEAGLDYLAVRQSIMTELRRAS
jgi:ATP-dependent Clp protease ATP-binding subunit ClpA